MLHQQIPLLSLSVLLQNVPLDAGNKPVVVQIKILTLLALAEIPHHSSHQNQLMDNWPEVDLFTIFQ